MKIKRPFAFVVLLFSFSFVLFAKPVRVGFFEYKPFQIIEDGNLSGFGYEYLRELQKFTDWKFEYITRVPILDTQGQATSRTEKLSYNRALEMLANGELDIVGSIRKTKEREELYFFPKFSSGHGYETITTLVDNDEFENRKTIKLGLRLGAVQEKDFLNLFRDLFPQPIVFMYYEHYSDLIKALHETKEIDYILSTSLREFSGEQMLRKFNSFEHYFAISKMRPDILAEFNYAHDQLFLQKPSFEDRLYARYYQNQMDAVLSLTEEEKKYIKENPVIQVAHETNWIPIDYEDKDGKPLGITPSILSIIAQKTGFHFDYISFSKYVEAFPFIENKANVMLASFSHDYGWAEKSKIKMTTPLFNLPVSIVALKHFDDIYDDSLVFAGIEGHYLTEKYVLSHSNYIIVGSVEECIDAVRDKKADITFVPTYSAERFLQNPKNARLHYHSIADIPYEISLAFDEDCDAMLFSVINKAVNSLSSYEVNQSIFDNTLYFKEPDTFQTFLYRHFFLITILVFTVLIFIIFLAFLASINFRRRRANEALSKANHELQKAFSYAEQANRAKTDFLSRISHEIRTPIHIITGMTDLSFDKISDQDFIFDALKKISSASDYLLALVNDVLDMSRIERGKTVINNDSFFISSVMDTIASLFEGKTKDKGIQLLIRTNKIENDYVYGDREHIEQVLINLLDNALKYTEKGKIEVTVFEEKRASVFSLFTFVVKDTGQGIEADRLRSIWEPFEKAKTKIKTKGSFGLGLSIVKSLVHLMGGTVQVESTPNEGSAFLFSVPLKILQATKEKRRKSDSIGEIEEMYNKEKILVVEDNDLNADIVRMMLERKNLTVDIVHDGKEAVDRLLETEATYYSLVLMDIRMPVMDGREATKLIRSSTREDLKKIPIVAMSADAFVEEIKLAQSIGMNEYLTKPVRSESLYAMVYLFLRGNKKDCL